MVIYKTTNLINGKIYIGKDTKNSPSYLGSGFLLKKAIQKYGRENFKKEILERVDNIQILNEREIFWINYFNSIDNGYNLTIGGTGGDTFSYKPEVLKEETRKKLKKRKPSDETLRKILPNLKKFESGENHPFYGKNQSEITKSKRKKSFELNGYPMQGKSLSQETKNKISQSKKGLIIKKETKIKMSLAQKGIKKKLVKCPYCGKFGGQPQMIQWHFDNCKYKKND
jgi:group I intron endonuclease